MSPRTAFSALVLIAGIAASFVLLPRALHTLHALNLQAASLAHTSAHHRPRSTADLRMPAGAPSATRSRRPPPSDPTFTELAHAAIDIAEALLLLALMMLMLVARRVRRRARREYALYELHLSTHDQAKGQDLEDLVEQIANHVRVWPLERIRNGQPYVAIELICGVKPDNGGPTEMEWSISIRCEPAAAAALDGAISATYPDVRLGRIHGEQPLPRAGVLRKPGCLMRFRKERSFVYSLIADGEEQASAPLEQIARAQVAVGAPTVVRFQLTPTPVGFEALARSLYRRHENKLVRRERWSVRRGGLTSTFNRAEMQAAERTQNRSLFWLETVVAADTSEACKTVAAAVQSRRGENRLHRRWMAVRQGLYCRRFPRALPPLIPSSRSLVSAAEVAHLLELPSARMKGVPVRRIPLPRIPAPPELIRGSRRPRHTGASRSPTSPRARRHEPELAHVGDETPGASR
jgi:hypothetical protein